MGKVEDLRALREARYEAARAQPAQRPGPAARPSPPAPPAAVPAVGPAADGRCGHRAISGRTCTRALGHAEKSHRYA